MKSHKPRTIRNVLAPVLSSYFHGRGIFLVKVHTKAKDPCQVCAMGHREYCGYKCGLMADNEDKQKVMKRVFIGDTIVCRDGSEYVLVRDENGSA